MGGGRDVPPLGSSPEVFQFSTRLVFSDMPYFCTSMMLLWLMMRLDSDEGQTWKRDMVVACGRR